MKNYILHGENLPQIHKVLSSLIEQAKKEELDITRFDWKKIKENDLKLAGRSQSLLTQGTLVIVENFFTGNKKSGEIIMSLSKDDVSYIFVEYKTLTTTVLKSCQKDFTIQNFPIPQILFNFLNNLAPGNTKVILNQFYQITENDSAEFLFIMLSRHIRSLIWVQEDPETYKGSDWQKQRLLSQVNKFPKGGLRILHTKLIEIDRNNKKSQLPENMRSSLAVLLTSI